MRDRRNDEGTAPRLNGAKVRRLLIDQAGSACLYRRATAGPSGQRADVCVGRVNHYDRGAFEVKVTDPGDGSTVGFAARTHNANGLWTFWSEDYHGGISLAGWSDSLSVGCDVMLNGEHAARGRHDSSRTSGGRWVRYTYVPTGA